MSTGGREKSSLFRSLSKVLHRKSKSGSVGSIGISTHSSYHTSAHGQYTLLCPWSVHTPLSMVSTHPSVHGQYTLLCPWAVHTPLSMVSTHPSAHDTPLPMVMVSVAYITYLTYSFSTALESPYY